VSLMAMLRHRRQVPSKTDTRLLLSARTLADVLSADELADATGDEVAIHYSLTSERSDQWQAWTRRVDAEMLVEVGPGTLGEIFTMEVTSAEQICQSRGTQAASGGLPYRQSGGSDVPAGPSYEPISEAYGPSAWGRVFSPRKGRQMVRPVPASCCSSCNRPGAAYLEGVRPLPVPPHRLRSCSPRPLSEVGAARSSRGD
jgi:hypothetical protein